MEFKELIELFKACEYEVRPYFLAGNSEKEFLAVNSQNPNIVLDLIEELCEFSGNEAEQLEKVQAVVRLLRDGKTYSFGDSITYWPHIVWEGPTV